MLGLGGHEVNKVVGLSNPWTVPKTLNLEPGSISRKLVAGEGWGRSYLDPQLPGKIVFEYKELCLISVSSAARQPAIVTLDPVHNHGKLVISY